MAKVAIITDTHHGARSDSKLFDNNIIKFYHKVLFPYIHKNNVDTILHLGDAVDRSKYITFQTLNSFRTKVMEPVKKMNVHWHSVVGNHDIPLKQDNTINAMNELFGHMENVTIYDKPTEIEIDGRLMLLMPWINKGNEELASKMMKDSKAKIMLGHFEFKGFQMYRGTYAVEGMDPEVVKRFDAVLSGHFHHKSSQNNIHYLGNPYELTWQDYADDRGFHILDTDTLDLTFIPNPHTMYEKVYVDAGTNLADVDISKLKNKYVRVVANDREGEEFDAFIKSIEQIGAYDVDIHVQMERYEVDDNELEDVEDTLTLIREYSKSVNGGEIDPELDSLMVSLYTEATNLSVRG